MFRRQLIYCAVPAYKILRHRAAGLPSEIQKDKLPRLCFVSRISLCNIGVVGCGKKRSAASADMRALIVHENPFTGERVLENVMAAPLPRRPRLAIRGVLAHFQPNANGVGELRNAT